MSKEVTSPACGEVVRADSEDDLVSLAQSHAKENHDTDLPRDRVLFRIHEA
jgi:predicted small metal-binding protein